MRIAYAALAAVLLSVPALASQQARIETSMGTIVIALETERTPATVANFVRYAKGGHFDNTLVYRVVPGFVVQTGSYGADHNWRAYGKGIPLETATGLSNLRGTVAMAREDKPDSATAEFFINLADTNAQGLDPKPGDAPHTTGYAVFGHVIEGMETVDAIAGVEVGGGQGPFPANEPVKPVVIKKVLIVQVSDQPLP
jgi:cyclophilin family peptidyl-prolyl cis-trans isomerase